MSENKEPTQKMICPKARNCELSEKESCGRNIAHNKLIGCEIPSDLLPCRSYCVPVNQEAKSNE